MENNGHVLFGGNKNFNMSKTTTSKNPIFALLFVCIGTQERISAKFITLSFHRAHCKSFSRACSESSNDNTRAFRYAKQIIVARLFDTFVRVVAWHSRETNSRAPLRNRVYNISYVREREYVRVSK